MKKKLTALGLGVVAVSAVAAISATSLPASNAKGAGDSLSGAGSSFVSPLVSKWQVDYPAKTGVDINYNPVGSGAGIAAITNRQVDFGASDAPLSPDQFAACKGCVQIPWALSATSIPYNLPGVNGRIRMTGQVLANIFLGNIKKWNAAAIKKLNPKLNLPDADITPVFRSDGSGTSYNFSDYLSAVSPQWKTKYGVSTQPAFPTGIGARGSSGVTGVVSRTEGALTYVDVAFALKNNLKFMAMKNAAGQFVLPGLRQIKSAAATVTKVPANNQISIVDPPRTKKYKFAYPICTFTYAIVPLQSSKAALLKRFLTYAVAPSQGQQFGPRLLFAPMPNAVTVAAVKTIAKIKQS
jgi:phosphate transport system substrate-binding protein